MDLNIPIWFRQSFPPDLREPVFPLPPKKTRGEFRLQICIVVSIARAYWTQDLSCLPEGNQSMKITPKYCIVAPWLKYWNSIQNNTILLYETQSVFQSCYFEKKAKYWVSWKTALAKLFWKVFNTQIIFVTYILKWTMTCLINKVK